MTAVASRAKLDSQPSAFRSPWRLWKPPGFRSYPRAAVASSSPLEGFAALPFARRRGEIKAKSGVALALFPEVAWQTSCSLRETFSSMARLDVHGDGALSFDALQMRLHPAESRIKRLSHENASDLHRLRLPAAQARQPLLQRTSKSVGQR